MVLSGFILHFGTVASADDALVLPKSRTGVKLEHLFSFPVNERWNPQGTAEELAGAFDGRALDSSVLPTLSALDPFVPGGRASIGDSTAHFEYQFNILRALIAYGITDQLTFGLDLTYYWVHNDVDVVVQSVSGKNIQTSLSTVTYTLLAHPFATC